jgi:hypothetical protein
MWLATKRAVSEALKKQVAAGQGWRCATCTQLLPAAFQVDHVMPLAVGGSNEAHNLAALCANCHADKTQTEAARVAAYKRAVQSLDASSGACWHCGGIYSTYFKHTCEASRKANNLKQL